MSNESLGKPTLAFPSNDAGERDGLNDAGIETFRDAPYASCAREAGQNSRDAAANAGNPVRLKFDLLKIDRKEIPSVEHLEQTLSLCLAQTHDDKEKEFFTNALRVLADPEIPVLQIADFNTKGLIGPPNKFGTPFNSLLKARGVSSKESATSGGSFGIGKNASIAVSELQTVFYSTRYMDPDSAQECFAAQGKVIAISHDDALGSPRRATGYWGISAGFSAVTDEETVPSWMKRAEIGTSIFSIGFRGHDSNWADLMICSLISNFFAAIKEGQMEFMVGQQAINANTLETLLSSSNLLEAAKGTALRDELKFARDLHRCLASELAVEENFEIPNLGKTRVRILTDKGLPCRVGFIRNGMLITDNLGYFAHKLSKFPNARDFVCVVEPIDDNAGRMMKSLENPQHRDFSADRIPDPKKRDIATKAMQALGRKIRSLISTKAGVEISDSVVIEELAHLFGEGATIKSGAPGEEKTPEKYTYEVIRQTRNPSAATTNNKGSMGGSGDHLPKSGARSSNPGNINNGQKPNENEKSLFERRKHVQLKDVRNIVGADDTPTSRTIYFTAPNSGQIELSVQALGLNDPEPLVIVDAHPFKVAKGNVYLHAEAEKRQKITINFDEPYGGPIELKAVMIDEREQTK